MTRAPLTPKQQAFVREYAVDRNGTQAAIRAGYSPRTADVQASRMLGKADIRAAVEEMLAEVAKKTETDIEWVRRRLKEEAENFEPGSSHAARVRAIEVMAKLNGLFELDNRQKGNPYVEFLREISGNVIAPEPRAALSDRDGDEDDEEPDDDRP